MKEQKLNSIIESLRTDVHALEISKDAENYEIFSALKNIASFYKESEAEELIEINKLELILNPVINDVQHLIEIETELRIKNKDRFNVFDCLTRHHLEELHSKFLSYLLNPKATHDCLELFLSLFLMTIQENPEIEAEFDGIELNLSNAEVIREKFLGRSYETDNYGFIDIYIHTNQIDIIIENKVKAVEQPEQLERYINYCKEKGQKYIALYLTLDGKNSFQAGQEKYYCISYDSTINSWLAKCIQAVKNIPSVSSGLTFYQKLLNEKILFKSSNNLIMKIKDLFLKEENIHILKYSKEIIESLTEIHKKLRVDFFRKVIEHLSKKYNVAVMYRITNPISITNIWNDTNSGFVINDSSLTFNVNEIDKIIVCVEHNKDALYYGLFGVKFSEGKISSGYDASKNNFSTRIEELMQRKNSGLLEVSDESWFMWRLFNPMPELPNFGSHELDMEFATNMDIIVEKFLKEFEFYISTWRETIKEIN